MIIREEDGSERRIALAPTNASNYERGGRKTTRFDRTNFESTNRTRIPPQGRGTRVEMGRGKRGGGAKTNRGGGGQSRDQRSRKSSHRNKKPKGADGTASTTENATRKYTGGEVGTIPSPARKNPGSNKRQQRAEPVDSPTKDDKQPSIDEFFKGTGNTKGKAKKVRESLDDLVKKRMRRLEEQKKRDEENRKAALEAESKEDADGEKGSGDDRSEEAEKEEEPTGEPEKSEPDGSEGGKGGRETGERGSKVARRQRNREPKEGMMGPRDGIKIRKR